MVEGKIWEKEVMVMKTTKSARAAFLAVLAGISAPLLIWVALVAAIRQVYAEWRVTRTQLHAGNVACSIKSDCPPGYHCIDGRCLPAWS
jgi:ABC-type uncharacterized transport system YnjBCD permease subunit